MKGREQKRETKKVKGREPREGANLLLWLPSDVFTARPMQTIDETSMNPLVLSTGHTQLQRFRKCPTAILRWIDIFDQIKFINVRYNVST